MKLNKDWKFKESFPTISAYTTAYNCVKNKYPIQDAVKSFSWVDEVVVVDGGSTDETVKVLEELKETVPNLKVYTIPISWNQPGKDGIQKAMAKAMCTGEYAIQFDADEFCLGEPLQWKKLVKDMSCDILELPVLEPFGAMDNLRLNKEHNPVKWRVYKNIPEITHGIPKHDRLKVDDKIYSKGMSDGCFPINIVTNEMYPSKLSADAAKVKSLYNKIVPLADNPHDGKSNVLYFELIKDILDSKRPAVYHAGHVNLKNKINLYLNEWRFWWAGLYNKDPNDISMYFDCHPDDVTEKMVEEKIDELVKKMPTVLVDRWSCFNSPSDLVHT